MKKRHFSNHTVYAADEYINKCRPRKSQPGWPIGKCRLPTYPHVRTQKIAHLWVWVRSEFRAKEKSKQFFIWKGNILPPLPPTIGVFCWFARHFYPRSLEWLYSWSTVALQTTMAKAQWAHPRPALTPDLTGSIPAVQKRWRTPSKLNIYTVERNIIMLGVNKSTLVIQLFLPWQIIADVFR